MILLRLLAAVATAFMAGKLASKIRLPAILGWLVTGIVLGPHALGLMNAELMESLWYKTLLKIFECAVGLMIGSELVWRSIKKTGLQIVVTTLTESLGTFAVVTAVFALVFYFTKLPLYPAFLFGSIALATAPAPSLSIVREFKTRGPVTQTLIPMAALDDIIAVVVFFTVISAVAAQLSSTYIPPLLIVLTPVLPLVAGAFCGVAAGFVFKKILNPKVLLAALIALILLTFCAGSAFSLLFPQITLNFMLAGMAFSAAFANMIESEKLERLMADFNPILSVCLLVVILNLGAPLDYRLIFGAGLYTVLYIISRATGKYFGAFFGAAITKSDERVKKYLGLTLLPHSGVSLVFTGIAVSVLHKNAPETARLIQGTIAAAAVINEVIAVLVSRRAFYLAGEIDKNKL